MSPRDQPDDHRDGWERRRDHAERVAGRKGCRQAAAASVALLVAAAIVIRRATR
jgi:hypothetical protein